MSNVKDYTDDSKNSHYNGVPSEFGRRVAEQNRLQPDYCDPGDSQGKMKADKRNAQKGA